MWSGFNPSGSSVECAASFGMSMYAGFATGTGGGVVGATLTDDDGIWIDPFTVPPPAHPARATTAASAVIDRAIKTE